MLWLVHSIEAILSEQTMSKVRNETVTILRICCVVKLMSPVCSVMLSEAFVASVRASMVFGCMCVCILVNWLIWVVVDVVIVMVSCMDWCMMLWGNVVVSFWKVSCDN